MLAKRRIRSQEGLAGVLLVAGVPDGWSQAAAPEGAPRFVSRSELVLVPAVVTDPSGKHARGLKQEDFRVLEDGVEQKIAVFQEVTTSRTMPRRVASGTAFTNQTIDANPMSATAPPGLTILALDFINTPPGDQIFGKKELLHHVAQFTDKNALTSLVAFTRGGGVKLIQDFTDDREALTTAIRDTKGSASRAMDQPSDGLSSREPYLSGAELKLEKAAEEYDKNDTAFLQQSAAEDTLKALQRVANVYAGVPGRKTLVWLTAGFPFDVSDALANGRVLPVSAMVPGNTDGRNAGAPSIGEAGRASLSDILKLYQRTWRDLNNAQIALYPVDVRGLEGAAVSNENLSIMSSDWRNHAHTVAYEQMSSHESMKTFAEMTGGRAYYNSNDLDRGFNEAERDSDSYYVLGYYADTRRKKAGWRRLSVKVGGEHLDVRARAGYFVTRDEKDIAAARVQDVNAALVSPLNYTAIGVAAMWLGTEPGTTPAVRKVRFALSMPPPLARIDDDDSNHFLVEFVAEAKLPDGQPAAQPVTETFESHLKPENAKKIRSEGMTYAKSLELPPGTYTVRFVVRDGSSGRIGSVAAPLTVK